MVLPQWRSLQLGSGQGCPAASRRAALALCLALELFWDAAASSREYFVRAEELIWDFGPTDKDLISGVPFDGHPDADVFMVNRPESKQIGRRYWKCLYEEYVDGSFRVKKPRQPWMGFLGPTFRCEVGDRLAITFQNGCSKATTMHPHGLKYNKAFEGAPYNDGSDGRGALVKPGETYIYLWTCDEHSGPGPADGSSVAWVYHSHNPAHVDANSGLIGLIIVSRRGRAWPDATPKDVDREFVLYLSVVDENKNFLLDRNIDEFIVARGGSDLSEEQREALKTDAHFEEGNLMHAINGRLYGNLEGFQMQAGEHVRWYVFSLGAEADLHSMHWKGHTVLHRGQRATMLQLMAGVASVADMQPTQAGQWGMYCHVNDHLVGGMATTYDVFGPSMPLTTTSRLREHFIQAEEVVWDYGPSGTTLYNTTLEEDEEASTFFAEDPAAGRIGGRYLKCLYWGYADASFRVRIPRPPRWRHLGMLGPVIRGEVGDAIRVTFSNNCSKAASINMPALLKPKEHEGWHYGAALGAAPSASGVVAPGGRHTYEWQVVDGPGPLDSSSVGFVYCSHQPMATDTNSGLVGLLIVAGFGQAHSDGRPLDVLHEVVLLQAVTDEGMSYLLDRNIERYILQRGGGRNATAIEALREDGGFVESNLMHGINGLLFGNLESPQLVAGERTRLYAMAVGTEVDLHSVLLAGHSFLVRGERRAQLNLMPNEVVEADFVPTAGSWALYCRTNDHLASGMIARLDFAPNPLDDPLVVGRQSGNVRRYYIRAEEVLWDYGVSGMEKTGQYFERLGHKGAVPWEEGYGEAFMASAPEKGLIGRRYYKCLYRGYDSSFSVPEDRSPGSKWEHLAVLGPIIHAEVGDTVVIELRNNCTEAVSLHPQLAGIEKQDEGFRYTDSAGVHHGHPGDAVQPGGTHMYTWQIHEGPGPRDGSSIATLYYSMAHEVRDTYAGLKGPLVITRKGFADTDGRPKDVDTELVLFFEVTDEGSSYLLNRNIARFVLAGGGRESEDEEEFKESNMMHGVNGQLYANLRGLTVSAETTVRWYVLSLGNEVDLHSIHWHGHTLVYGGHRLDVVMNMPATGITADMYVDNVGKWLLHCHVDEHMEGGMVVTYEVVSNPDRGEAQISSCQQMYGRAADVRREGYNFTDSLFEGHAFDVMLSPDYRVAYTVNYVKRYFDMVLGARTTGWVGIGFYGQKESKSHAMIDTDMIIGRVQEGTVSIEDRFAMGLETPKLDAVLGADDQLQLKEGLEEGGVTYLRFRRSFHPRDVDQYDFRFEAEAEQVQVVFAYSAIDSDSLVYHGPTRGHSELPWNTNCSSNHFFNLRTSECEGCDRGFYRVASDPRFSLTRCERCPVGSFADLPGNLRTAEACEPCGVAHGTTLFPGSTSHEDCLCKPGFFHPCDGARCGTRSHSREELRRAGFCVPCPVGMECLGGLTADAAGDLEGNHTQPTVPSGFYSPPAELSVFRCSADLRRCPGGAPGSCSSGREGIQCARCFAGWRSGPEGTCVPCTTLDHLPLVFGKLFSVAILGAMYYLIVTEDHAKRSHSMLLVSISGSQLVSAIQMLGAISLMSIDWAEPMGSIVRVLRLLSFDIEVLNLECVLQRPSPMLLFCLRVLVILAFAAVIVVIHVLHVLLRHRGRFRNRRSDLYGTLGTMFMVFFLSTTTAIFSPLQCGGRHPNGLSTPRSYPTVVCFESGEHPSMVAVAMVASLIPVSFIAVAIWVVRVYPERIRQGDTQFLCSFAFLTVRFRKDMQWYALAYLGRSVLISLTPAIPDLVLQMCAMELVLLTALVFAVHFKPWRIWQANVLEAAIIFGISLVVSLSALFVDDVDSGVVSAFCFAVVITISILIPMAAGYGLYSRLRQGRGKKPFGHFICHHKAGAGACARLLKLSLASAKGVRKKVFIDSDDLRDLDKLFDYVANQTDTLVILCSKDILTRTWCMGEITTAMANKVKVVKVNFHDFVEPDVSFIHHYSAHVPDVASLTPYGISLSMVQDALQWFRRQPVRAFPEQLHSAALAQLAAQLAPVGSRHPPPSKQSEGGDIYSHSTMIIADDGDCEAQATAYILERLLGTYFVHCPSQMPKVLSRGAALPSVTACVLLVCTPGVFYRPSVLRAILAGSHAKAKQVPIMATENFRFPSRATLPEYRAALSQVTDEPEELFSVVLEIFAEIAAVFHPNHFSSTEVLLQTKAQEIASRLQRGELTQLSTTKASEKAAPDEQDESEKPAESDSTTSTAVQQPLAQATPGGPCLVLKMKL